MNKHVAKLKGKLPLVADSSLTDAEIEKFLRDNHGEIAAKLRVGKAALDRGDSVEVKSVEELLAGIRKRTRRAR
jgi:hypothetical protein